MLPKLFMVSTVAAGLAYLAASEPIRRPAPDRVHLSPRAATCTPQAGGSSTIDDVPAIQSAINACPSGTIVIPSGQTYYINSQLSFAGCSGCTFELLGELSVSTDFNYWNGKGQIIHLQSITGAIITGSGTVNGNGQASCTSYGQLPAKSR
jgi:galacturan 1,4-alpha-galacturonidase